MGKTKPNYSKCNIIASVYKFYVIVTVCIKNNELVSTRTNVYKKKIVVITVLAFDFVFDDNSCMYK